MKSFEDVSELDSVSVWLSVPGTNARFRLEAGPPWITIERDGIPDESMAQDIATEFLGHDLDPSLAIKIGRRIRERILGYPSQGT